MMPGYLALLRVLRACDCSRGTTSALPAHWSWKLRAVNHHAADGCSSGGGLAAAAKAPYGVLGTAPATAMNLQLLAAAKLAYHDSTFMRPHPCHCRLPAPFVFSLGLLYSLSPGGKNVRVPPYGVRLPP